MAALLRRYGLYAAWLVSIVATLGSLYFSEVRGFIPCELCWFQRVFMYPLTIVLGIATYQGDRSIARYVLPLTVIGGSISTIHYLMQRGVIHWDAACSPAAPCTAIWINWWGFVTIPFLAGTAFVLITLFLAFAAKGEQAEGAEGALEAAGR